MARRTNKKATDKRREQLKNNQEQLVEFVIKQLSSGVSWKKCWDSAGFNSGMPVSKSTGETYKGGNLLFLMYTAVQKGYTSNEWGTFNAWKKAGGWVRKDEKSTPILFWKPIYKEDEAGELKLVTFYIKGYNVFNRDQIEGLPATNNPSENVSDKEPVIACDEGELFDYCEEQGIKVARGHKACYSPITDSITLPEAFTNAAGGWSTVAHEMVHSTGHKSRLNREGVANFDHFASHNYSYEELVAELGSLFLCSELGLSTDESKEQSAAYCAAWAKKLQDKPEWLWKAAGEASQAVAFIKASIAAKAKKGGQAAA